MEKFIQDQESLQDHGIFRSTYCIFPAGLGASILPCDMFGFTSLVDLAFCYHQDNTELKLELFDWCKYEVLYFSFKKLEKENQGITITE
jgi:hypothetical protein